MKIELSRERNERILAVVNRLTEGQCMIFMVLIPDENPAHPHVVTNIPEELLKGFVRALYRDIIVKGNVEMRCGDEIAFELEARPDK